MLEAGWTHLVDCVIVVTANRSAQLKRIQSRQRMVKEEIFRRIQSQMPLKEKSKWLILSLTIQGFCERRRIR